MKNYLKPLSLISLTHEKNLLHLTYGAWCSLAFFLFISISLTALFHVLILIPGLYYTYFWIKNKGLTAPTSNSIKDKKDRPSKKMDGPLHEKDKIPRSCWGLLALVFFASLSIVANREDISELARILNTKYFLMGILAIAPTYHLINSPYFSKKKKKILLFLFLLTATLAHIVGLVSMAIGYNYLRMKDACSLSQNCGMYGSSMSYAHSAQLLGLILLGGLIFYKRFQDLIGKKVLIFITVITLLGFYLALSRGALLGFLLAFPLLFWNKTKKLIFGFYGIVLTLIVTLLALIYFDQHPKFLFRYTTEFNNSNNTIRLAQYKVAYYAFKENPILGFGFRNFSRNGLQLKRKYQIKDPSNFKGNAHNNYLEILAGCGLLGLLALMCFQVFWLVEILQSTGFLISLFLPLYVGFSISGLFQNNITDGENMFFFMALYALFQAIELMRKRRINDNGVAQKN